MPADDSEDESDETEESSEDDEKQVDWGWTRPLTPYLEKAGQLVLTVYGGLAGFCCYFAMYAFRKPFKAVKFPDKYWLGTSLGFKTALVLAQLLGYMTSKFVGVKYVAEAKKHNVSLHLLAIITFAQLSLVLYAAVPEDLKVFAMFLNGLPLGVIWGLVVGFLEGRRTSDYMLCGLCFAFIVSSGAVKDAGLWVHNGLGVSKYWMPPVVSAMFYPLFVLCVWLLYQMPPPSAEDIVTQSERKAMDYQDRVKYVKSQTVGVTVLWIGVMILTAYRDYRDTFQTELFEELLGHGLKAGDFSKSETIVGVVILIVVASLGVIKDNEISSKVSIAYLFLGSIIMLFTTAWLSANPELNAYSYMIMTGIGSYLSYVPYNSVLFERLIAYTLAEATVSFPMAVNDALGYLGTFAVYLVATFGKSKAKACTDSAPGATDSNGGSCSDILGNVTAVAENECVNSTDDSDFSLLNMCCVCGGGDLEPVSGYVSFFQLFGYATGIVGIATYSVAFFYYFVVFPRRHRTSSSMEAKADESDRQQQERAVEDREAEEFAEDVQAS